MRGIIYFILFILVCTLSILFFAQNDQDVVLSYFIGQLDTPLAFIIVGSLLVGYFIGVISLTGRLFKLRVKLKQAQHKLGQKTKEVENLRSLPIKDDY
ncbi:LapA family protein [Pleionea mediterranea]|uniref:Putative membrane protein n=1 Tax=Pleionea mediterranea TaxID=523701 RepID=A0A316G8Q6_9GAMM|nr:LapA family protein [Pleionea mediterranea]PWK50857.1 putative membrane protein [Pleionea mediterranea]